MIFLPTPSPPPRVLRDHTHRPAGTLTCEHSGRHLRTAPLSARPVPLACASTHTPTCLPARAGRIPSLLLHCCRSLRLLVSCARTTTHIITTDRARAPQVRHSSPLLYIEVLYLHQYFPHLFPPPSVFSFGRVPRRIDRNQIVIQPVGLTVKLPLTTHGLTPARTWTGGLPGLTPLGHPGPTDTTHGTVVRLTALVDH